jgi:hypothetical protein
MAIMLVNGATQGYHLFQLASFVIRQHMLFGVCGKINILFNMLLHLRAVHLA